MSRLLPITQNTDLVTFAIEVDGTALPLSVPVYAIEVATGANQIPTACLYIADGDASLGEWPQSSGESFVPGKSIRILAGYHSENEEIFAGIIISQCLRVRHRRLELQVTCKHEVVRMSTAVKYRHFADTSDSEAVSSILAEYEIPADITEKEVIHTDLASYQLTDWDFIIMRMEANGLICTSDSDGFHALVPDNSTSPVATLQFGANIIEFDADIDARRQFASSTVIAWDPASKDVVEAQAADPQWTVAGNLDAGEIATADESVLHYGSPMPSDEIQALADARLLRSRMAFLRGRARVQGLAAGKPGVVMELSGFGDRFNGPVWVGAVRHELSAGNWLTDIEFGLPESWHAERYLSCGEGSINVLPGIAGLHTGIVTAIEGDPEGEQRIRVRVPAIDNSGDGLWARISLLDAGNKRGTFFLPEIDDEVIVGFLGNDPRHPVVLGMVHSSAMAPPETLSDDNHVKGYYSRSGMRVTFDDDKKVMTLDTPGKRTVILDDNNKKLTLADGNGNKIEFSSSGILVNSGGDLILKAAQNLKAEGSMNMELKAGAQWKAEGSAGTELNSSALTVVKGSLVQIN
jgi:Rhs element Vgr protein